MGEQLDLFAPRSPRVRKTDPWTSSTAARSLRPAQVANACGRILAVIEAAACHGATCAEILARLGGDRGCTARRTTDLAERGLVYAAGDTRPGPSGRAQLVWRATAIECTEAA